MTAVPVPPLTDAELAAVDAAIFNVRNPLGCFDNTHRLLADAVERLRAELATCTCGPLNPETYEGPQADCAVHGAIRAFNDAVRENERLKLQLDQARAAHARAFQEWGGAEQETERLRAALARAEETAAQAWLFAHDGERYIDTSHPAVAALIGILGADGEADYAHDVIARWQEALAADAPAASEPEVKP